MRLVYRLADRRDDPALRRLLASVPMPGAITVTFAREPDYFAAMRMTGREWQVLIAENAETGELAGVLCRCVQERFVNGAGARIAYWGQLRIKNEYQGSVFLPRAFAFAKGVYEKDPVDGNFAVIAEENPAAKRIFAEKHARLLPRFEPVARILTFGIMLGRRGARGTSRGSLAIERGSEIEISRIVSFLQQMGASRQLFPVYEASYFVECGYDAVSFIAAKRRGRLVGIAGLWDQSGCKQTIVKSYGGLLGIARPFYNFASPLTGRPPLPAPGEKIRSAYLSFIAVEEQDPGIFSAILEEACRQASARGFVYLMLGLCEADPLAAVPRSLPHIPYCSTLYTVELAPDNPFHARLDGRIPYVEIATL